MTVEHAFRWQYLYEARQAFDGTPPGWHNFGRKEAHVLEQQYQAKSDAPATITAGSSGYEYSVDVRHMTQRNRSTGKERRIRRLELPLRRVVVEGGSRYTMDVALAEGEAAEWFFETEGPAGFAGIDFRATFLPSAGDAALASIQQATWHSLAGDFVAPSAGNLRLAWENYYKMASARTLLLHCTKPAAGEAQNSEPDASLAEFLGEPAAGAEAPAAAPEERGREAADADKLLPSAASASPELQAAAEEHTPAAEEEEEDAEDAEEWEVVAFDPFGDD